MRVAIIKPDHLGDLILSTAAIRAISQRTEATLFVAPWNHRAAVSLLPTLNVETITFSHLSKAGLISERIPDLRDFDFVAILRNDEFINERWADLRCNNYFASPAQNDLHQTILDYAVAQPLIGHYDIDASFYHDRLARFTSKLAGPAKHIGLSVGSGFHANLWPISWWIDLTKRLVSDGKQCSIIAGPSDIARARCIALGADLDPQADMIIGGGELEPFLSSVDNLDLVIATDGGGAHLCSLVTPIIAIFGPSPFRRYAPFGRATKLLTRELECSPCCQYATNLINGCLSTECMTQIKPDDVIQVIDTPVDTNTRPTRSTLRSGTVVWTGVSHTSLSLLNTL